MTWTPLGFRTESARNRLGSIDTRYLHATTRHFPACVSHASQDCSSELRRGVPLRGVDMLSREQAQALTRCVHLLPGEEWRPVVGFEEFYAVSSLGRVFSRPRERTPGGIMRGSLDGYGYRRVGLMGEDRKVRSRRVHVLVMRAFRGEPTPEAPVIRHLDGDKANPALSNLVYGTQVENGLDSVRHGTSYPATRTHCPHGHEYSAENTVIYDGRRRCRTCRKAADQRRKVAS